MTTRIFSGLLVLLLVTAGGELTAQSLEADFRRPAPEFRPKTWLHVMSENMSAAGMTKDLEAIAEVGIGGVLIFNVTQGIPVGKVKFNSEEHTAIMAHAAAECQRLGLTFGLHNCDGWSSSGGPWNTPENSMKMVVWADTILTGGGVEAHLPQPPVTGGFYEDIATLAWPVRPAEREQARADYRVSASDPNTDLAIATDGLHEAWTALQPSGEEPAWVQFSYPEPRTVRSLYFLANGRPKLRLQSSDDGKKWREVTELRAQGTGKHEAAVGYSGPGVRARHFRILSEGSLDLREVSLSAVPKMNNWLGLTSVARTEGDRIEPLVEGGGIDPREIIDLSDRVDASGHLRASLPAGEWTVMRFGHTTTGAVNIPASAAGTGPEADKFRRAALKTHYDAYVGKVVRAAPPGSVGYVEIDSYEVGGQNWTQGFRDTFRAEYGYDLTPYLPLFAGRLVGEADAAALILDDLRRLYARLLNDNYYGYFTQLANADGLKTYIEPYGGGPLNNLAAGGRADIPMGEFWLQRFTSRYGDAVSAARTYGRNIVSAEAFTAFADHNWSFHPALAKTDSDRNWAHGFNEYVFHRFAHQANTEVTPGMTMNRWGSHFDRTQTWWRDAGAVYFDYLTRGQFMLRRGVPVSDVLVFVGDAAPTGFIERERLRPQLPATTNYDCVNAEVLLHRIKAKDGALVLPEGTRYAVLSLQGHQRLTLPTLRRIGELAAAGVPVIGFRPTSLLGYRRTAAERADFDRLVREISARPNVLTGEGHGDFLPAPDLTVAGRPELPYTHRRTADGADIYFIHNPEGTVQIFEADFRVAGKVPELWDPQDGSITRLAAFRTHGGRTAVDFPLEARGSVFVVFRDNISAPYVDQTTEQSITYDGTGNIVLETDRGGPREFPLSDGSTVRLADSDPGTVRVLQAPWSVTFPRLGAAAGAGQNSEPAVRVTTDRLFDWRDDERDTIRYFSGTATYGTTFEIDARRRDDRRLILDLGVVHIAARVTLNGRDLGVYWKPPFRVDITDAVVAGENRLEIAVTNQWNNHLVGDERYPEQDDGYEIERYRNGNNVTRKMVDWYANNEPLPPGPRTTFSTATFHRADSPLFPSGLLGPVRLLTRQRRVVVRADGRR